MKKSAAPFRLNFFLQIVLLCILFDTLILTEQAHAYIDPAAGSFILQALAGIFVAAAIFWRRITTFIKKVLKKNGTEN